MICNYYYIGILTFLNFVSGSNLMTFISQIEPLNGGNYSKWKEQVEMTLALADIDLASYLTVPLEPVAPVRAQNESSTD